MTQVLTPIDAWRRKNILSIFFIHSLDATNHPSFHHCQCQERKGEGREREKDKERGIEREREREIARERSERENRLHFLFWVFFFFQWVSNSEEKKRYSSILQKKGKIISVYVSGGRKKFLTLNLKIDIKLE